MDCEHKDREHAILNFVKFSTSPKHQSINNKNELFFNSILNTVLTIENILEVMD